MAIVLVLVGTVPVNALNSTVDSGYIMPTQEEQLKANFKANAVLTMKALQENGQFALSAAIGETIFGKNYVMNSTRSSNRSSNLVSMTHYSQETDYYCGPAACRSVISVRVSSPPSQYTLNLSKIEELCGKMNIK